MTFTFKFLDGNKRIVNPRITKKRIKEEILKTIRMRPIEGLYHHLIPSKKSVVFSDRVLSDDEYQKFPVEVERTNYFLGIVQTPRKRQEILFFLPIGELLAIEKNYFIFPPDGRIEVKIKLN